MNTFDQMTQAMKEARDCMAAADKAASEMARILRGRMRHVARFVLEDLKRELRGFNIQTGEWKK